MKRLVLGIAILIFGLYLFNSNTDLRYVETNILFFKVSNQCISDHYYNDLTEDGFINSFILPPEDCDSKLLDKYSFTITGNESSKEAKHIALQVKQAFSASKANAYIIESIVVKDKDGNVLENVTQKVKEFMEERKNEYDPGSPSDVIKPRYRQTADNQKHSLHWCTLSSENRNSSSR